MNSLETLTEFLGWCTVISVIALLAASFFILLLRGWMVSIHSRMLGLDETQLSRLYAQYMAHFKLGIFLFNLVPYLALKFMT